MARPAIAVLLAGAVLAASCGRGGETLGWSSGSTVTLSGGGSVAPCPGDAPLQCVTDADGTPAGAFEFLVAPAEPGAEGPQAAQEAAEGLLEAVGTDRARGCPDLRLEFDDVRETTVAGASGVRTGFRMLATDGRVVERTVVWIAFRDGQRVVVNAAAYDEGACLERVGEFSVAGLDAIVEELDVLVGRATLP